MKIEFIELADLLVNKANDRHGELQNETAAIGWLFREKEQHMKNLAKDIVQSGRLFEPPLVFPTRGSFVVYDGNRRVTCLKLLAQPLKAPTTELQTFFKELKAQWVGDFPTKILCQVEDDLDEIDQILFRRHTGAQNGVGQSTWTDRMKANFVERTGKSSGPTIADEIEKRLKQENRLPTKKIPRSTMNRLLSSEPIRARIGFSFQGKRITYLREEQGVVDAFAHIANDLANKKLVLGQVWDNVGKTSYLDKLESGGLIPTKASTIPRQQAQERRPLPAKSETVEIARREVRSRNLIPQQDYGIVWTGRLERLRSIWNELQFELNFDRHANAIAVLFRVLLELSIENCLRELKIDVTDKDNLARKALKVGVALHEMDKIDEKQLKILEKFKQPEALISADTLNQYIHSQAFAASPEHLQSLWVSLSEFIVESIKAHSLQKVT